MSRLISPRAPFTRPLLGRTGGAVLALLALAGPIAPVAAATTGATETILFIRHGEKSPDGFGQLSCKGLNRALALAGVLQQRYRTVDAAFAPDPSKQKPDGALSYDYVRPLATVEPTAIRFGLPVHAAIGYDEPDKLIAALQAAELRGATVLVAWEHHQLNKLVPRLIEQLGATGIAVPVWPQGDFDSIWRVSIARDAHDHASVQFAHEQQNLDKLSDRCPN